MKKVYEVIIPGWTGQGIPKEFPFHVRLGLWSSMAIPLMFSIRYFGLPFGMISHEKRLKVIQKINDHPNPNIRNTVQLWKLVAFMTKC